MKTDFPSRFAGGAFVAGAWMLVTGIVICRQSVNLEQTAAH
jgi:hypothetical protein